MSVDITRIEKNVTQIKRQATRRWWLNKVSASYTTSIGLAIIIGFVLLATVGSLLIPYSPYVNDYTIAHQAPSLSHFFGTDNLGRDVFSRIVIGTREALGSGILIVGIALLLGIPLGLLAGYFGGWVDEVIMRLVDTALALPGLVLAMAISWTLGPSFINSVFAVSVIMAPQFIRIMRGQVLVLREKEFILAARSQGVPSWRIMTHHILRNSTTPLIVAFNLNIGYAIMIVASLAFLGLGTPPPFPSWGGMLQSGIQFMTMSPWISFFPGLFIFLLILAFNMFGEGVRDLLDPQSKK